MTALDFSYEASLYQQYKTPPGKKIKMPLRMEIPMSPWVELINDLVTGAGYSYSRIAYRIKVSPSTIQKLATNPKRKPRLTVFHPLQELHLKVFQGEYATPKAREYWKRKILSPSP